MAEFSPRFHLDFISDNITVERVAVLIGTAGVKGHDVMIYASHELAVLAVFTKSKPDEEFSWRAVQAVLLDVDRLFVEGPSGHAPKSLSGRKSNRKEK